MSGFVHLRVKSSYSLSEGAVRLPDLVKQCQKFAMPAVAVTDTGNLFGALEFSGKAVSSGVQPIIGAELFFASTAEVAPGKQPTPDSLVLLVQNAQGYANLLRLMGKSYLHPAAGGDAPLLSYDDLTPTSTAGLIALTAGTNGALGKNLFLGRADRARVALMDLQKAFPGRIYVELSRHGMEAEKRIEAGLLDLAYDHDVPIVATNHAYFLERPFFEAHDALSCIAGGRYVMEEDRPRLTPEHHFKSPQEMQALFADLPEAIANTVAIAKRCGFAVPERAPMLPSYSGGDATEEAATFRKVAREGLAWRLQHFVLTDTMPPEERERLTTAYGDRLEFEMATIERMQFPGYFLIVSDFIRWSKEQGIPVGPGRGSGAGSLVAWAMQITDLDPIRYGLLFERFLNPERVSMPDFDVDFCQERRDEVIQYVQRKYGTDRVAQIITFGTLQARGVLRDVGRVLHIPYPEVDRICKLVPNNPAAPVTLAEAIQLEPMLKEAIKQDERVERMSTIALQLEGLNRHASTHAAGVVIADRPLDQLVPLYRDPKSEMPVVQFSMKYAEMSGLVKFDFLGLKTLTVLVKACKMLSQRGISLDLLKLPLDDQPTYDLLGRGETVGVFQLESAGMRDTLRKLKPDCIEDIIALVSLYRPGPMDNIPTYVARKHGKEKAEYLHPLLEPILKETCGVIIYQEQVMQIAQVLAGYSLGQADLLRRAMGKKIKAEMDAQREIFARGAEAQGVKASQAKEIFDLIAKFASYGFNKSHAAAYAMIAYQTAFLKANYPVEFFAASMSLDMHNTEKLAGFRQDAMRLGVSILPPDINRSGADFTVEAADEGLAVRYALGAVRNVGQAAMQSVERERAHAPYRDMADFMARLSGQAVNKRQLEFLVKSGALDSLSTNRRQLLEHLDALIAYNGALQEERASHQQSLFGGDPVQHIPAPMMADVTDWSLMERVQNEFEAIGFYLSAHPLDPYGDLSQRLGITLSSRFTEKLTSEYSGIRVAGVVVSKKIKVSPKGKFAFLTLTDPAGLFELAIYDESVLSRCWGLLETGTMVLIGAEGKLEESGPRMIAQSIQLLDDVVGGMDGNITLILREKTDVARLHEALGPRRDGKKGAIVQMRVELENGRTVVMSLPGVYSLTPPRLAALKQVPGVTDVQQAA
jgi:DNA polymerase-3 subunit alpha